MKKLFCILTLAAYATAVQAQMPQEQPPSQTQSSQTPAASVVEFPPIEDVTGKIQAGFWESYWHWISLGGIVLAAGLFLILRRKTPPPSPYEIASGRLSKCPEVYEALGAKAYAQEVSQAVRDYIEAVHNIPAPERTTEEFLTIASESELFDKVQRKLLEDLLKLADLVKFSMEGIDATARAQLLEAARKFVDYDNLKLTDQKRFNELYPEQAKNTQEISTDNKISEDKNPEEEKTEIEK